MILVLTYQCGPDSVLILFSRNEGVEELNVMLSLQSQSLANQVMVEPAVATVRVWDNDSKFS